MSLDPQITIEHEIFPLHEKQVELLKLIEQVRFGELRILIKDGLPVYADEIIKRHDLKPVDNSKVAPPSG